MVGIRLALAHDVRMQIAHSDLPEPVAEYQGIPGRKFRFDQAWPAWKVALEVDGGLYMQGRHQTASGYLKDCEKRNLAQIHGWIILSVTTANARSDAVPLVREALEARGWTSKTTSSTGKSARRS